MRILCFFLLIFIQNKAYSQVFFMQLHKQPHNFVSFTPADGFTTEKLSKNSELYLFIQEQPVNIDNTNSLYSIMLKSNGKYISFHGDEETIEASSPEELDGEENLFLIHEDPVDANPLDIGNFFSIKSKKFNTYLQVTHTGKLAQTRDKSQAAIFLIAPKYISERSAFNAPPERFESLRKKGATYRTSNAMFDYSYLDLDLSQKNIESNRAYISYNQAENTLAFSAIPTPIEHRISISRTQKSNFIYLKKGGKFISEHTDGTLQLVDVPSENSVLQYISSPHPGMFILRFNSAHYIGKNGKTTTSEQQALFFNSIIQYEDDARVGSHAVKIKDTNNYLSLSSENPSIINKISKLTFINSNENGFYFIGDSKNTNWLSEIEPGVLSIKKTNSPTHGELFQVLFTSPKEIILRSKSKLYVTTHADEIKLTSNPLFSQKFLSTDDDRFIREYHLSRKNYIVGAGWNCSLREHINHYMNNVERSDPRGASTLFDASYTYDLGAFNKFLSAPSRDYFYKTILGIKDERNPPECIGIPDDYKVGRMHIRIPDWAKQPGHHGTLRLAEYDFGSDIGFQSVHDIDTTKMTYENINQNFSDKYWRRLERMKKEQSSKDTSFLRFSYEKRTNPITPYDLDKFFELLNSAKRNHLFLHLSHEKDPLPPGYQPKRGHYLHMNVRKFPLFKLNYSIWFVQDHYDWDRAFVLIEHYREVFPEHQEVKKELNTDTPAKDPYLVTYDKKGVSIFTYDIPSKNYRIRSAPILTEKPFYQKEDGATVTSFEAGGSFYILGKSAHTITTYQMESICGDAQVHLEDLNFSDDFIQNATIQTAVLYNQAYLIVRAKTGVLTYRLEGARWNLLSGKGPFSDAEGWNFSPYYKTIQTFVSHTNLFLLARGANGIYTFILSGDRWKKVGSDATPPLSNHLGWDKEESYSTIQTVENDGETFLIARNQEGIITFKFTFDFQWEEMEKTHLFSNKEGFNKPEYYSTLQTFTSDNTGYLLARTKQGVKTYKFIDNKLAVTEDKVLDFSADSSWSDEKYYSSIQTQTVGLDTYLFMRGSAGLYIFRFDNQNMTWLLQPNQTPVLSDAHLDKDPTFFILKNGTIPY